MSVQWTADALVLTRVLDAPRALVFDVFTQPEHLQQWFAPKGFTVPHCTVDLRAGGLFHSCMRSPEGKDYWTRGIFQEIVPAKRIVYVDSFSDAEGNAVSPVAYGLADTHPMETVVCITFEETAAGTVVTLRHEFPEAVSERNDTLQGWTEMFDRAEAVVLQARVERISA